MRSYTVQELQKKYLNSWAIASVGGGASEAFLSMLTQWKPNLVLVGLPLNMDDTESELSARARKFARRLEGRFNVQVEMVDERLTSQEAKSIIRGNSKRGSSTEDLTKIDHIAAALILQSWLDDSSIGRSI